MMVSESLLNYLDITPNKKQQIGAYFDIVEMINLFRQLTQRDKSYVTKLYYSSEEEKRNKQFEDLMEEILPSVDQIADILRYQLDLPVDQNNTLTLDVLRLLDDNLNLTGTTYEIPFNTNISGYIPSEIFNLSALEGLRTRLPASLANDPLLDEFFKLLNGTLDEKLGISPGGILKASETSQVTRHGVKCGTLAPEAIADPIGVISKFSPRPIAVLCASFLPMLEVWLRWNRLAQASHI